MKNYSLILSTLLLLTACQPSTENPCVAAGKACCVVTTGPGNESSQCVSKENAAAQCAKIAAINPTTGAYPQNRITEATNACR